MDDYIKYIYERTIDTLREQGITDLALDSRTPPYQPIISAKFVSFGFVLDNPGQLTKLERIDDVIAYASNCQDVIISRDAGTVWLQYTLPKSLWQKYTFEDLLGFGIGVSNSGAVVKFEFDESFPHCLIAGSTGSGKSILLETIISYLICNYSEDDLRIAICDPHQDLETFESITHLIEIGYNEEDMSRIILKFKQELLNRKKANLRDGTRLVLVLDEAQDILGTKDSGFHDENLTNLQQIAREARKYKIHLILATQKTGHMDMPKIFDSLTHRYVGKVSDAQLGSKLTGLAGTPANKLLGEGDFLQINGQVIRFQAAKVEDFSFIKKGKLQLPYKANITRELKEIDPYILSTFMNGTPLTDMEERDVKRYTKFAEILNGQLH